MQGLLRSWGKILAGTTPALSIEITRECPLTCPGCYAYSSDHLGESVSLRQLSDHSGPAGSLGQLIFTVWPFVALYATSGGTHILNLLAVVLMIAVQFTFNGFLKVAFQGSRVTSDAGLLLVRELDERLGLERLIAQHLSDSRYGLNTQFSLADLLRQEVTASGAGRLCDEESFVGSAALGCIKVPSRAGKTEIPDDTVGRLSRQTIDEWS